jgi:predicted flap endonuclease-1-like 5' DNA nuclease
MNFDSNTLLIVLGAVAALVILLLIVARSRKQRVSLSRETPAASLRAAPARRPLRGDGPEGDGVADEAAAAARDVAGEILGVEAHPDPVAAGAPGDNLQTLKGVGPKLAAQLAANGITRFEQLAALTANEIDLLDAKMGPFRGRIGRDRLVEQAAFLARGDTDGFEAQFGKLGGAA